MKKSLSRLLLLAATTLAIGTSAVAQQPIDGYFRVQNASSGNYVEVRGPFTAQPDCSFDKAAGSAGTVMYINATPDGNGLLSINSLRCQGIEVVGEPIDKYMDTLENVLTNGGFDNVDQALWTLVRGGFDHGYTSIGRALLEGMIFIVAARLDDVGVSEKEELANFANRFNKEVADNISLTIKLEPVGNNYRLCYDIPDLKCVSDWYLLEANKATFEKGFESMRRYLANKIGNTGEYLQPDEVAEMQAWGYDPTVKHHNYVDNVDGRFIYVPYEEIFADHELLFNWLKLNMIKFTDEDRCPQIELMGFYLPNFAKEMKKHALTAQLISYFPRLRTNERAYLTDGKNGVFGHLDFTSAEGADALGLASQWTVCPITAEDGQYLAFTAAGTHYDELSYAPVYVDFGMEAVNPETTKFYTLAPVTSSTTINDTEYLYYEIVELSEVPARTPVLIEMTTSDAANHRIIPVNVDAPANVADEDPSAVPYFHGFLMSTPANYDGFRNQWGLNYDSYTTGLHRLGTKENNLWYNEIGEGSTIPANEAFLAMPSNNMAGYAVKEPKFEDTTSISDIEAADRQPDTIYDLSGRRVSTMTPGNVYILNGKKILAF